MQQLMKDSKLYSVKLKAGKNKTTEIGEDADSVVANSDLLAKGIEKASCETCTDVNVAASEETTKQ